MFTGDGGNWTILLWPAALALAAIALLIWSWRGRRVGEHPHCRRCGFDLFGNPAANRCGECGADLTRRRAVAVGLRRRRPLVAATALFLALACGAWGGFSAKSAGLFDRKPDWLLRWELSFDSRRPAALDELADRIENKFRLSQFNVAGRQEVALLADPAARRLAGVAANPDDFDDECRDFLLTIWFYMSPPARREVAAALLPLLDADDVAVASRAAHVLLGYNRGRDTKPAEDVGPALAAAAKMLIDRQGDRGREWDSELADVVLTARKTGVVDDADWSRFARQMIAPQLYARSRIRADEPLPQGIAFGSYRGYSGRGPFEFAQRQAHMSIDKIDPAGWRDEEFQPAGYVSYQDGPPTDPYSDQRAEKLPVGRHTLLAAMTFRFTEGDDGPVVAEWHEEWAVPFEVVPAEQDVVRAIPAPGLAAAFAGVTRVRAYFDGTIWISGEVPPCQRTWRRGVTWRNPPPAGGGSSRPKSSAADLKQKLGLLSEPAPPDARGRPPRRRGRRQPDPRPRRRRRPPDGRHRGLRRRDAARSTGS